MPDTKVWAHRGASGYAPENTFEAFRLASDMNADGVELDVQLTKDGQMVIIHDETIDRTSDGSGWVKDYTLRELKAFNYNKTHPEYEFALIPTLEDVYQWLKHTDLIINVELKTGVVRYEGIEEKVLDAARQMRMEDRIIYSSFNMESIIKIKKIDPNVRTGFLCAGGFEGALTDESIRGGGYSALHPSAACLNQPGVLAACREKGLLVHVWTVNEEELIRAMYRERVDAIITNYPDRALKIRGESQ